MTPSLPFNSVICLIGTFLGLTLGCFLLFLKSKQNRSNIFLGILVLGLTLYLLPIFVNTLGWLERVPHVLKLYQPFSLIFGPIVFFYILSCTQKGFRAFPKIWFHLIPGLLDIIYHIPYYSQNGDKKIEQFYLYINEGIIGEPLFLVILRFISALVYLFLSLKVVHKYKQHLADSISYIDEGLLRWMIVFCSILFLPVLTVGFHRFTNHIVSLGLVLGSIVLFIIAVYSALIFKPLIFHPLPHRMLVPDSPEEKNQKYEKSNLQENQKEKFVKKIVAYVDENKPYKESELTLSLLAEQVKIPAHYLSQVINERLKCNFLDFINGYRIKEAKEKLVDSAYEHYTIIAIAYEVGFNSKTAFYSAFKKNTGTTPSRYRKSLLTAEVH